MQVTKQRIENHVSKSFCAHVQCLNMGTITVEIPREIFNIRCKYGIQHGKDVRGFGVHPTSWQGLNMEHVHRFWSVQKRQSPKHRGTAVMLPVCKRRVTNIRFLTRDPCMCGAIAAPSALA